MQRMFLSLLVVMLLVVFAVPANAQDEIPTPTPEPTITPTPNHLEAVQLTETDTLVIQKTITYGEIFVVAAIALLIVVLIILANFVIARFLPSA